MAQLRSLGFQPIELERYCASNKIWMTKVKRLRLPDLLCVRTGLRVEVRAKSDLKIRMSDAPANPDRKWDAGLRDDDLVAFIAIDGREGEGLRPADEAMFFTIRALSASAGTSKLGPPKSASEGAERDRTWPATVPSRSGVVFSVSADRLVVDMGGDGNPDRRQTYNLTGKNSYVQPGDRFTAGHSILAGSPTARADIHSYLRRAYDPIADLGARQPVDRYAAVKALPYREDLHRAAVPALERLLRIEDAERVALEAAGSAATLGSAFGRERIEAALWGEGRSDLRMEAVLILTELGTTFARRQLCRVASEAHFQGDEIRQAAVWGLGKAGLKEYEDLVTFIGDPDENVALHAIVAFGPDTPEPVIRTLVGMLIAGDRRLAPSASEALRIIGSELAVRVLSEAASLGGSDWCIATLGRMPPELVRSALRGTDVLGRVTPVMLLAEGVNWLATEDRAMDVAFLLKQTL
ncbi:MAG TPA: hypothetical protein VD995_24170 [Azospirillum sp.]|nr:hypothetical protein [Azospirillum sp.]